MGVANNRRLYYGWYIVGVCFFTMAIGAGVGSTFAVFIKSLIEEFHWSRTELSGVVSIGLIVGGLVTPFWGNRTDRAGGRKVVVAAAFFGAFSLLLRSQVTALWQLYAIAVAGALCFAGISLIPFSTIISQWFRRKRGTAIGITLIGSSLGGFIMPPVANYLIDAVGWRKSYMIFAALIWAIVPVAGLILRKGPRELGILPDGDDAPGESPEANEEGILKAKKMKHLPAEDLTLQQAMRTSAFWFIAAAFFLPMMSGVGLLTHLFLMLTDAGISTKIASAALGIIAGLSMAGRFTFGFAADRFDIRKIFTACYIFEAIAVCALLTVPIAGKNGFFAYILIYGLTGGGGLVLAPLLIGECFGLKSLGTIFGVLAIAAVLGGAIGPLLCGIIFESTGSYYLSFIIFAFAEAGAALAISRARPAPVAVLEPAVSVETV